MMRRVAPVDEELLKNFIKQCVVEVRQITLDNGETKWVIRTTDVLCDDEDMAQMAQELLTEAHNEYEEPDEVALSELRDRYR